MKTKLFTVLPFIMLFLFVACEKDDPKVEKQDEKTVTYTLSRKTGFGNDWVYFSFATGKEVDGVTEENRTERLDWDIAFNRTNMRTNSGESGKGKGGALNTKEKTFGNVKEAPTSGYTVDEKSMIMFGYGQMMQGGEPEMGESTLNKILKGAIAVKPSSSGPIYQFSKEIYIIKTANGKYVKVEFTGYHNDEGKSGYVTFKYEPLN